MSGTVKGGRGLVPLNGSTSARLYSPSVDSGFGVAVLVAKLTRGSLYP